MISIFNQTASVLTVVCSVSFATDDVILSATGGVSVGEVLMTLSVDDGDRVLMLDTRHVFDSERSTEEDDDVGDSSCRGCCWYWGVVIAAAEEDVLTRLTATV